MWNLRLPIKPAVLLASLNLLLSIPGTGAPAATDEREWTSSAGTKIQARAISLEKGNVMLLTSDKRSIKVSLDKFVTGDQEFLRTHFGVVSTDKIPTETASKEDNSITLPKGTAQGPILAGEGSNYHLYIPKSLPQGRKHPLMMVLNPHHGNNGTLDRYVPGAERNGWILITSVESNNDMDTKIACDSILKAINHAKSTLPVDPNRVYIGGFSGGSSRSFRIAMETPVAGILACGMGGAFHGVEIKRDVPIYILSGSNCWNREDPGVTLARFCPRSKDSLARYFPGNHDWAGAEWMEDGMTHLNEVFLSKHRDKYHDEALANETSILRWADEMKESDPARALMWTTFLIERPIDPSLASAAQKLHASLSAKPEAVKWVKGLKSIHRFAIDDVGKKGWEKSSRDLEKLTVEYSDTPWKETLDRMLKPIVR